MWDRTLLSDILTDFAFDSYLCASYVATQDHFCDSAGAKDKLNASFGLLSIPLCLHAWLSDLRHQRY